MIFCNKFNLFWTRTLIILVDEMSDNQIAGFSQIKTSQVFRGQLLCFKLFFFTFRVNYSNGYTKTELHLPNIFLHI